jgi:hypothetical protein
MNASDRIRVVPALKPEVASFNMGSINFSVHPIAARYKDDEYKHPWEKDFLEIARAVQDLAERARSKRLSVDDVQGGTFHYYQPRGFRQPLRQPLHNKGSNRPGLSRR